MEQNTMGQPGERTMSLNGEWDLALDPENTGKQQGWMARFPEAQKMTVPGVWEYLHPGYDGVGWYRTSFVAPDCTDQQKLELRFGAVQYFCECWLNGEWLGDHEGGFTPFAFDLAGRVRPGVNQLVVRVINPPINREIEGFRAGAPLNQSNIPVGKAAWYFNFGGIWQDVELARVDQVRVGDVFVRPYPAYHYAEADILLVNESAPGPVRVTCSVRAAGGSAKLIASESRSLQLGCGESTLTLRLAMPDARLWSPEDPFLHVATVEVHRDGELRSAREVRFGMRAFTIKGGCFVLNGKPVRLKGFLHQGVYPRTLSFPETREIAEKEMRLLKDNGFNFMRAHLRPPNSWYLDLADELGILVEAEPAIGWITNSPETEGRCRREIEGMIRRDRNHPSIVFWCLLNEAYHFLGFSMPQVKAMTARLAAQARQLDATRLLMDTSGGGGNESPDGAILLLPDSSDTVEIVDAHAYCPLPPSDADLARYRDPGAGRTLIFCSEYGAPEAPPDFKAVLKRYRPAERRRGIEDYQLHKDFHDSLCEQFRKARLKPLFRSVERLVARINEIRADEMGLVTLAQRVNPRLGGLTFCQLSDASGELFGATDIWREKKPLFDALRDACQVPAVVAEVSPRLQVAGSRLKLRVVLINEDQRGGPFTCRVEVLDGRCCVVKKFDTVEVVARRSVQVLLRKTFTNDLPPGPYVVRATLSRGRRTVAQQETAWRVLARPQAAIARAAVFEKGGTLAEAAGAAGIVADRFSNNYRDKSVPVLLDMRGAPMNRMYQREIFGQVRKIVELGGSAVLFEPEAMLLYEDLFPALIRLQPVMRSIGYIRPHPVFAGLPVNDVAGYEYADLVTDRLDRSADIEAAGGEVLFGTLSMHMWTRPADYTWGAAVYTVPVGRGTVIVCNLRVLDHLGRSPAADLLFSNLVNFAGSRIQPGRGEWLQSRCIDPLPEAAWR